MWGKLRKRRARGDGTVILSGGTIGGIVGGCAEPVRGGNEKVLGEIRGHMLALCNTGSSYEQNSK